MGPDVYLWDMADIISLLSAVEGYTIQHVQSRLHSLLLYISNLLMIEIVSVGVDFLVN